MAPLDQGVNAVKRKAFCPICNSALGGEMNNQCPTHGVVNPEFGAYQTYRPDLPGKQKPDHSFIPTGTPLTAAVLEKNQLEGHPDDQKGETLDFLKEWRTDDERHFDGPEENADKNTLLIVEPSLEEDDEDFTDCDHGDVCSYIVKTWEDLCGDDR